MMPMATQVGAMDELCLHFSTIHNQAEKRTCVLRSHSCHCQWSVVFLVVDYRFDCFSYFFYLIMKSGVRHPGMESSHCTVILSATADGNLLPPFVIFRVRTFTTYSYVCDVTFWIEESCSVSGLKPTKISIWSKFTENRLQPKRFLEMQTIYFLEFSNSYFGAQLCNIGNCFGLFKKWTNVIGTYLVVISTISIFPASVFFYLFLNLKPHTNIEASRNSPTCDRC